MADELLYHYCSLDTFLSIVKHKTLRLSNIKKSNDYQELIYILSGCEEIIFDFIVEKYNIDANTKRYQYLGEIKRSLDRTIRDQFDKIMISHAMCFSKDGDKLSQWRGYANDGCGVAIGFDYDVLKQYLSNANYITLSEVQYNEHNEDFLKRFINDVLSDVSKSHLTQGAAIVGIIQTTCNELVKRMFLGRALTFKNPAFSEENEVRIHTVIPRSEFGRLTNQHVSKFAEKLEEEIKPLTVKYDFHTSSSNIVSHFDICFDYHASDETTIVNQFIKEIVIGPKATISIPEMQHIMKFHGLAACTGNIKKSKASYR